MKDEDILDTIALVRSTYPYAVDVLGEALNVLDEFERRIAATSDKWDSWPAQEDA